MNDQIDIRKLNTALCQMLGIDPSDTVRVSLTLTVDELPAVVVHRRIKSDGQIVEKRFSVTEVIE